MKSSVQSAAELSLTAAIASWLLCTQGPCLAAEQALVDRTEQRVKTSDPQDAGILPGDQFDRFASTVFSEAARAGIKVMSASKVSSQTNGFFTERRESLLVEATESQLLAFLQDVGSSNSLLRVESLSLRPNADRSFLQVNIVICGTYVLRAGSPSQEPDSAQTESLVLGRRRHLRRTALDCYTATKAALPPGWTLESLSLQNGKRLALTGTAPADQVSTLPEVQTKLQQSKGQHGSVLFLPASGESAMRMGAPGSASFSWSIECEARQPDLR